MKASSYFGGQYLGAADLDGRPLTCKITAVTFEVLENRDGIERERIVLHCDGVKKPVIVNATNADKLIPAFGDETDDWIGKRVQLVRNPRADKNQFASAILITPMSEKK